MAVSAISSKQREFRCRHCEGKILIPKDLPPTTGPCPHCGEVITSAANEIPVLPLVVPIPQESVETDPPHTPPDNPERAPTVELPSREVQPTLNLPDERPTAKPAKPYRSGLISTLLVLLALILLAGGGVWFAAKELGRNIELPSLKIAAKDPAVVEANYIRSGWQQEAYQLLRSYLAATSAQDKLPFILNASGLATKVETFYRDRGISDADTPADVFSIYELSEDDRKRGLFMMIYDQPPQFGMQEFFRPLASLEVQYGVDDADLLLTTLAHTENFAPEPLRVQAFFKRTPAGLKLDWEIYAQTKYRTLRDFVELPDEGKTEVFRVLVAEDFPEKGRAVAGSRTYRVVDPANNGDSVRINVKVDSDAGRALSSLNWRDLKEARPLTRTATVELKWSGSPTANELEISRFVCWEFLGLGGLETPAKVTTQ